MSEVKSIALQSSISVGAWVIGTAYLINNQAFTSGTIEIAWLTIGILVFFLD